MRTIFCMHIHATTLVGQRKLDIVLQSHSDICQKPGHIQRCNQTDAARRVK